MYQQSGVDRDMQKNTKAFYGVTPSDGNRSRASSGFQAAANNFYG
jgi:hypothetical protein